MYNLRTPQVFVVIRFLTNNAERSQEIFVNWFSMQMMPNPRLAFLTVHINQNGLRIRNVKEHGTNDMQYVTKLAG